MSNELEQALQTHLNNELSGSHLKKRQLIIWGYVPIAHLRPIENSIQRF